VPVCFPMRIIFLQQLSDACIVCCHRATAAAPPYSVFGGGVTDRLGPNFWGGGMSRTD
jgi:hypothetical protein